MKSNTDLSLRQKRMRSARELLHKMVTSRDDKEMLWDIIGNACNDKSWDWTTSHECHIAAKSRDMRRQMGNRLQVNEGVLSN